MQVRNQSSLFLEEAHVGCHRLLERLSVSTELSLQLLGTSVLLLRIAYMALVKSCTWSYNSKSLVIQSLVSVRLISIDLLLLLSE